MGNKLDPRRSNFITLVGRKGSGKSVLATSFWHEYPFDRVVIDPTGDVDTGDPRTIQLAPPLPARWPVDAEGRRVTLRFVPDPRSPTWLDDCDRVVAMAHHHPAKRCMVWLDEVHMVTTAHKTPPNLLRALIQGRHKNLNLLMCGPRPLEIHPLVMSQADFVAVFHLPNPDDREKVAKTIGYNAVDFDAEHERLDEYGYLWWDTVNHELMVMDPLPLRRRRPVAPPDEDEAIA